MKVLDFGLAKLTAAQPEGDQTLTASLTVAGTLMGSLYYMSPEQARAEGVDVRSDIFSFGTVLYEILTGERPFDGPNTVATLSAILTANPKPLKDLPAGLEKLRVSCHEKELSRRAPSMEHVKQELELVQLEAGWSGPSVSPRRPNKSSIGLLAAAAVALAAGVYFYNPAPASVESAVLTRLTANAGLAAFPSMSRDGKIFAYASDRAGKGNLDIWVRQMAGADPIRITSDAVDAPDLVEPDATER